jgi:hypothetical protein
MVDARLSLQSVFNVASTSVIRERVEAGLVRGPIQIDYRGRVNYLWRSTAAVGARYEKGVAIEAQYLTKVALSSAADRRHQFPESETRLDSTSCSGCGAGLFG